MAETPAIPQFDLSNSQKIYFASDFHLGAPNYESSREREVKIVKWLDEVSSSAAAIFLVGDIFDFWFEYKYTIPKGFIRFQGKLAELRDKGVPVYFFTGNHDMWMFDYFQKELEIPIFRNPISFQVNNFKIHLGHGDGLGPGDRFYKFLKKIFTNRFFQWVFHWAHSNIGMGIAQYWSKHSRITNDKKEDVFEGENEWLLQHCREVQKHTHHDYYVFGHRHLPLELKVANSSVYFNLGEWVHHYTYLELDEKGATLKSFNI